MMYKLGSDYWMQTRTMPKAILHVNHPNNRLKYGVSTLNKAAFEMINSERIVFDSFNLRIRLPDYDDNKTSKLLLIKQRIKYKNKIYEYAGYTASFSFTNITHRDISGKYELEKEGDYFILHKVNDN